MNIKDIAALRAKAHRSLAAAIRLAETGDYDFAVSRIYYAMFYMAETLLQAKGLSFSKHAAVIAAFHGHFVRTGLLPRAMHKLLHEAFEQRNNADYAADFRSTRENISSTVRESREFLAAAETLLTKLLPQA